MEFLEKIVDFINGLETSDIYKYLALFFAALLIPLSLLIYLHYSKVHTYQTALKSAETLRAQTKKILSDYRTVNAQKEKVEEILSQNKDFRIGEAYQSLLVKLGLATQQVEQATPTAGETVSGKTEILLNSHINSLTMKQVTDLLSQIAAIPQMYIKDLVIKKAPNTPTVDIELTVATLEPSTV